MVWGLGFRALKGKLGSLRDSTSKASGHIKL